MSAQQSEPAITRRLEILGIGEEEERVYHWLLTSSSAVASEVAEALALSPSKTRRLLGAIEAKGLVTQSPESPRRYIAVSPEIALKVLALRRKEELQRLEDAIQEMQNEADRSREKKPKQMVELITNREASRQTYDSIQRMANKEVVCMMCPPIMFSRADISHDEDQSIQRAAQARGVRYRSLIASDFLELPNTVDWIRCDIKTGEEVRLFPSLPFKLFMVDHRIGLIPLITGDKNRHVMLLLRTSPLLDALYSLFELLWERGTPLSFTGGGQLEVKGVKGVKGADPSLSPDFEKLIWLMVAGLNDKKIADELGVSSSTLKRRIAELMRVFNARTRFQLGRHTASSFSIHAEK